MATRDLTPEWILKQTLEVSRSAHDAFVNSKPGLRPNDGGLTLTVLGCGTMGLAILGGILDSLSQARRANSQFLTTSLMAGPTPPPRLPTKFNACVRRHESAERIKSQLGKYNANLMVYENKNLLAVQDSDVILLSCRPQCVGDILQAEGVREALADKLLISICAGVSEGQIHDTLYGSVVDRLDKCSIVRAMPNAAAAVRESMTIVAIPSPTLSEETNRLVTWIFSQVGRVMHLPVSSMDACTALCGSGPGFVSVIVESLAAGAISMGVSQEDSYTMAAQMLRGTAGLLIQGEHPAILRDKVATPGGCTIDGLAVLEEGAVRGTVTKAVREATLAASRLGQSKQNNRVL